ncbi:MAG TPA: hypothetical protein PLZ57_00920 [Pseudobdellovibrionaceae bacterium]|nr:hypothetical protein [Pseudobdellovibrionaceae bacterium]
MASILKRFFTNSLRLLRGLGKIPGLRGLLALALGVLVAAAMLEFLARAWIQQSVGDTTPAHFLRTGANQTGVGGQKLDGDHCTMADMLRKHPFTGYILGKPTNRRPCQLVHIVNERGTLGLDYESSEENFVIAIAGGSYAEQASILYPKSLQNWLNARYLPPRGREFKVVSAANGGWHLPQQAIHAMLHAERFDFVVHLFGLNEWGRFGQQVPLEEVAVFHHLDMSPFMDPQLASLRNWLSLGVQLWTDRLATSGPDQIQSYALALALKVAQSQLSDTYWMRELQTRPEMINTGSFPNSLTTRLIEREEVAEKLVAYAKKMSASLEAVGVPTLHFLQPYAGIDPPPSEIDKPWPYMKIYPTSTYKWFAREYLPKKAPGLIRDLTPIFKDHAEPVYIDGVHHLFRADGYVGIEVLHEAIGREIQRKLKLRARPEPGL